MESNYNESHKPWAEKYRPNKLESIYSQSSIKKSLKKCIKQKNLPHLLFYGPSGCGKTSTIFALTKELFPDKLWEERVMELNASDERGINIVRERIKNFAKNSVNNSKATNVPPWKIIILDEADSMTSDSQFALRRIIEKYSNITRFCIICNYKNKIIEPISSRCSHFRFKSLPIEQIIKRLRFICDNENINYSDEILEKIVDISRGDMRKAINYIQMCYFTFKENLSIDILNDISGIISNQEIKNLFDIIENENLEKLIEKIESYENNGYSLVNQIRLIYDYVINSKLDGKKKSNICKKISEVNYNLTKGCDEIIQYTRLFTYIRVVLNKKIDI